MLSKNLKYHNKDGSASANAYTSNIAPQNGTGSYLLGQTIIINIPTRANLCLIGSESTLKFTLSCLQASGAAANVARLDRGGANGIIQRLRLYSGSNLLEDVDSYRLLVANLISFQKSNASVCGKHNISNGTRNDDIVECFTTSAVGANTTSGKKFTCPAGEKLWTTLETATAANNTAKTYSISLLSILGALGSQYIPLFAIAGSGPLK